MNPLASTLPAIDGAPLFIVRGPHSWGRSATIEQAIKTAHVSPGAEVHVCRCDDEAYCEPIAGNLETHKRGEIWRGKITRNGRDVALLEMTHPVRG